MTDRLANTDAAKEAVKLTDHAAGGVEQHDARTKSSLEAWTPGAKNHNKATGIENNAKAAAGSLEITNPYKSSSAHDQSQKGKDSVSPTAASADSNNVNDGKTPNADTYSHRHEHSPGRHHDGKGSTQQKDHSTTATEATGQTTSNPNDTPVKAPDADTVPKPDDKQPGTTKPDSGTQNPNHMPKPDHDPRQYDPVEKRPPSVLIESDKNLNTQPTNIQNPASQFQSQMPPTSSPASGR